MYDDFDAAPTRVMVRPQMQLLIQSIDAARAARPRQKSLGEFAEATNLIKLSPEFMERVRGVAPRKRFPKALFAFVAVAALFAIPSVRSTTTAGAQHVVQAVSSHVMLSR